MSFQDLDFKSDKISLARSGNPLTKPSKLLARLFMAAAVVMLLGFSVSNWPPAAKAADSTPKSSRLHYSLPLPAPAPSLEQEIREAAAVTARDATISGRIPKSAGSSVGYQYFPKMKSETETFPKIGRPSMKRKITRFARAAK